MLAKRRLRRVAAAVPFLITMLGCSSTNKVVFINYQQTVNFTAYQFAESVFSPQDEEAFEGVRVLDTSAEPAQKNGVWLLYQICAIRNDEPSAEPFNFDVSKFFVKLNDTKFYCKPLQPYTYVNLPPGGLPGTDNDTAVSKAFSQETQTAPSSTTINKATNIFGNSWSLVIYVSEDYGMPNDITDSASPLKLGLFYDAPGVYMVGGSHQPVFLAYPNPLTRSQIPLSCDAN
jgi:hypothetical protein